jgi:hypothetical protein
MPSFRLQYLEKLFTGNSIITIKEKENKIMFTVDTHKGSFKVGFKHETSGTERTTEAVLWNSDKSSILVSSLAFCHEGDNFDRYVGRKVALTRLLGTARDIGLFDKEMSTKVWEEYWKLHHKR